MFLAILNNDIEEKYSSDIVTRFTALNKAMFVKFKRDTMVYPPESAWFWQVQADGQVLKVDETDFYKKDQIGLRTLNEAGKVIYEDFEGDHL